MARYKDGHFDLAIVDPPYGIGMAQNAGLSTGYTAKDWDKAIPPPEYFRELFRVSKNQIIWGGNYMTEFLRPTPAWIIWDKRENIIPERTFADGEMAWTSFNCPLRIFRHYWDGFMQRQKEERIHPTQKPVALYKWILNKYAKPGNKILDTHLGSASIALACHDYGFDLTACEMDEEHFADAMRRVEAHVRQASLLSDLPAVVPQTTEQLKMEL